MKVSVIGTGYVGLVTGTCLAENGHDVCCVDIDSKRIKMLNKGILPVYEPGLEEIFIRNFTQKRLHFTCEIKEGILRGDFILIAVGTPSNGDGSAYLKSVFKVARDIGNYMNSSKIIIIKSTVPVGTTHKVKKIIDECLTRRNVSIPFNIAFCPEFLKEGSAVNDFQRPDRIVIGINENGDALQKIKELLSPFVMRNERFVVMSISSAELTKYAANSMLATRISFMNELSHLCEKVGADIEQVRKGVGSDTRIGSSFLYAGIGYGGSCFPKDVKALIHTAEQMQINLSILKSVEKANTKQKAYLPYLIDKHYNGNIEGLTFAIWGLSFKPHTDDIREAPSLVIIQELINKGASIQAFDPIANENVAKYLGINKQITYFKDNYEVLRGANALLLLTEWPLFRKPNFDKIKNNLKEPIIFDGRNQYDPQFLEKLGFTYYGIGRNNAKK